LNPFLRYDVPVRVNEIVEMAENMDQNRLGSVVGLAEAIPDALRKLGPKSCSANKRYQSSFDENLTIDRQASGKAELQQIMSVSVRGTWVSGKRPELIWAVPILLAAVAVACYPMIRDGYVNGHSSGLYVIWTQQFLSAFQEGDFFPAWAPYTHAGTGSGPFYFYPPLLLYLSVVAGTVSQNVVVMLILVSLSALIAAAFGMYGYARRHVRPRFAMAAACVYVVSPYFLLDLYERAALAEFLVFPLLPLLFLFVEAIQKTPWKGVLGIAAVYASLTLAHLPSALLITPFLGLYVLCLSYSEKSWRNFTLRITACALGGGLAAFYLIPALVEQQHFELTKLYIPYFLYSNNFLFSASSGDAVFNLKISFMALALLFILLTYAVIRALQWRSATNPGRDTRRQCLTADLFAVLLLLALFFMTAGSKPAWQLFSVFQQVQFPWRLMAFATFLGAVLIARIMDGLVGQPLSSRGLPTRLKPWTVGLLASLPGLVLSFSQIDGYSLRHRIAPYSCAQEFRPGLSYLEFQSRYARCYPNNVHMVVAPEYKPKSSPIKVIDQEPQIPLTAARSEHGMHISSGSYRPIFWSTEKRIIETMSDVPATLSMRASWYPAWHAFLGGREVEILTTRTNDFMVIRVPAGKNRVEFVHRKPQSRRFGLLISLLASMALAALAWRIRKLR
jgi:hypothetical protein